MSNEKNARLQQLLGRRSFLVGAGGVAAAAAALSGCDGSKDKRGSKGSASSSSGPMNGASHSAHSVTPTYQPFGGMKSDLPARPDGVLPGVYHYPANPTPFVSGAVGGGGPVTMMLQQDSIKTPESKNAWWQALNKALNVDLKYQVTVSARYAQKFQVIIAGGASNLPDVLQIVPLKGLPQLLKAEFSDLTEHLAGDAVKEYPGLASIPTSAWAQVMLNGRIWGIPRARTPAGGVLNARGDLLKKKGLDVNLANGQDFLDMAKELSAPDHQRWAFGAQPVSFVLPVVLEMMESPANWSIDSGHFVSAYEAPQRKEALDIVAQMWSKQYIHPDSFINPASNFTWWEAGMTTLFYQAFGQWSVYAEQYPSFDLAAVVLPKWKGGGAAAKILGPPAYPAYVAFRAASANRVKELLRICNYIAAPFGTREYLTVNFGVPGTDYTLRGTDPVVDSARFSAETMPIWYAGSQSNSVLYVPGDTKLVNDQYDYLKKVMVHTTPDPTLGLYSETALGEGVAATKVLTDLESDIIQGRKPVSSWDGAVKAWKKKAGDKMAKEYEQASS